MYNDSVLRWFGFASHIGYLKLDGFAALPYRHFDTHRDKNAFQRTLYTIRWHLADCNKKSVEHLASVFHRFCVVGECVA